MHALRDSPDKTWFGERRGWGVGKEAPENAE